MSGIDLVYRNQQFENIGDFTKAVLATGGVEALAPYLKFLTQQEMLKMNIAVIEVMVEKLGVDPSVMKKLPSTLNNNVLAASITPKDATVLKRSQEMNAAADNTLTSHLHT